MAIDHILSAQIDLLAGIPWHHLMTSPFMKNHDQLIRSMLCLAGVAILLFLSSCRKETQLSDSPPLTRYQAEAAIDWADLFLEVERYAAGYRPGPAPRALAYIGLATYEATISGMPDYRSLAHEFAGLDIPHPENQEIYHWPSVVHGVHATLMPLFFPHVPIQMITKINLLTEQLNDRYRAEAGIEQFDRSFAYGALVAQTIWTWSKTDTFGHDAYKDPFGTYDWQAAYNGPGDWRPTLPGPGKAVFPYWGQVRTFSLNESEKLCQPPLSYSESPFSAWYAQALEIYAQSNAISPYLREWIGEFWSDDLVNLTFSPGPRWLAIANQVLEKEDADLQQAIVTFAKLGLALHDANVACWHSKYVYNVERPETYIQRVIDPNWDTNLTNPLTGEQGISPSFPAYPSGHSTMGAAAAEILGQEFGYSYPLVDQCHAGRIEFNGTPRGFESFYAMAQENAWSRVLLGVHFRMDSDEGVRFGTAIGRSVNRLPWRG